MSEPADKIKQFPGANVEVTPRQEVAGFWPEDATVEAAEYLLDQWLADRSSAYLYGRHGSLKTFLLLHIAFCGALGRPVMGYAVPERFGTVFCVGEKKSRFGKRVVAWQLVNDAPNNAGVYTRDGCPDLTDSDSVDAFIDEINAMKPQFERRGAPLKMIVLDTLSRALRAGNVSDPATAQLAINAKQRIIDETGCTVLSSAHVAKAEGSDTIKGAGEFGDSADTYIRLERDKEAGIVTATLGKQSDGPDGLQFAFRFQPVVVGQGRRGDIWSGAIEEADVPEDKKKGGGRPATAAEANIKVILNAYGLAHDEKALSVPVLGANGATGVTYDHLRAVALDRLDFHGPAPIREADESEKDHAGRLRTWRNSRDTAFRRALGSLTAREKLIHRDGFVWEPRPSSRGRG